MFYREPCNPTSIIILGGFEEKFILLEVSPNSFCISSFTIFTICSPGFKDFNTSCPKAFSSISAINSFTILKLTSASKRANFTSLKTSFKSDSIILTLPPKFSCYFL